MKAFRLACLVPLTLLAAGAPAAAENLFLKPALLPLPEYPMSVALGDVTGDGRDDVVLGTTYCAPDCQVLVLPQTPFGGLATPIGYPAPEGHSVFVGDLDDDGREDVLVAGGAVEALAQNAAGGLAPMTASAAFREAWYAAAGHMNGDGRLDVVSIPFPELAPAPLVADVHEQQPGGGFVRTSLHLSPWEWCDYCSLKIADLDRDGREDLLIADLTKNRIQIAHRQADGTLVRRKVEGIVEGTTLGPPAIGNFDNDPWLEIVAPGIVLDPAVPARFQLVLIDQTTPRTWKAKVAMTLDQPILDLTAGDLNGDGRDDLAAVTVAPLLIHRARVYLPKAGGTFDLVEDFELPFGNFGFAQNLAIGDLNGDRRPDVAIVVDNFGLVTLVQKGSGEPAPAPELFSAAIPDFGFTVRIASGAGTPAIAGTLEPSCIEETICVSGALPGRSEVFLRVVGPKPNGRLWPTLVKFSTSMVDVWVHQISTGEFRHYRLNGAARGVDELPGLFDREGFQPTSLTGAVLTEAAPPTAPPPPDEVFLSEEFPNFRFRARISTSAGGSQSVRKETACIEETLCLSGAIPGRSEVFVRIVGPKPNGRLWPTIVKFTTSTVEVWIEQISTGEEKYYRIEGAAPGKDDLTGIFDRMGFKR